MALQSKYKICLDIGGTKILGAIFDDDNKIIYRLKKRTKADIGSTQNVEDTIISVVDELIKDSGIDPKSIKAIAAGAPGVINHETGVVIFAPNLPWRNYNILKPIEARFGVPFYIGNDVNVGVLGEYKFGVAQGFDNVVGIFVGTGLGGGFILDGKLYTGNLSKGGEIGHMILNEEGPCCNCGQRGCLEAFSSKQGISEYIMMQVKHGRDCCMKDVVKNGTFRSKYLKSALEEKDPVATEAVDRACHYLAIATGNLINTFSPQIVVFGGGVIESCGDAFIERITAQVDKYCMPSIRDSVVLKNASLGDDSVLYGALSMILDSKKK